MRDASATAATVALFHSSVAQTADIETACLALIGAALACCEMGLRQALPHGKADEVALLLTVAGANLIEDGRGPLELAETAGTA